MTRPFKINRFEDLIVWQKSMSLAAEIYRTTRHGDFVKDWGLKNQTQRAPVSIPSNIAEGFERYSNKEFRKYLLVAKGGRRTQDTVISRQVCGVFDTDGSGVADREVFGSKSVTSGTYKISNM